MDTLILIKIINFFLVPFVLIVGMIKYMGGEDYLFSHRDGLVGFSASVVYGIFFTFKASRSEVLMSFNLAHMVVGLVLTIIKSLIVGFFAFIGAKFYGYSWTKFEAKFKKHFKK
mgnify:FL=1